MHTDPPPWGTTVQEHCNDYRDTYLPTGDWIVDAIRWCRDHGLAAPAGARR